MAMPSRPVLDVSEEEMARARLYNFIAALLSRPPTQLEIDVARTRSPRSAISAINPPSGRVPAAAQPPLDAPNIAVPAKLAILR